MQFMHTVYSSKSVYKVHNHPKTNSTIPNSLSDQATLPPHPRSLASSSWSAVWAAGQWPRVVPPPTRHGHHGHRGHHDRRPGHGSVMRCVHGAGCRGPAQEGRSRGCGHLFRALSGGKLAMLSSKRSFCQRCCLM